MTAADQPQRPERSTEMWRSHERRIAEAVDVARGTEHTEHKPGDPHRYRIECEVCGQRGTIRLSVDPDLADPDSDV